MRLIVQLCGIRAKFAARSSVLDVMVRAGAERTAVCAYGLRDSHVLDEIRKGTAEVT